MKKTGFLLGLATAGLLVIAGLVASHMESSGPNLNSAAVAEGPLAIWSEYEGRLEAERLTLVMSHFQGSATVIDIAPEGSNIKPGDVLVRFDVSQLEHEIHKLERDAAVARSDYDSLKNAKIPLEIRDLEIQIMQARTAFQAESNYLEASRPLVAEGLVSESEMAQQKLKVDEARTQLETLEMKLKLTRSFLHPAALGQAQAKLDSAEQDLKFAQEQIQAGVVKAAAEGVVVYKPFYIGGEFRTVRIGDSVFPNQPIMALPDPSELSVQVDVPEAELARIAKGQTAVVRPVAYNDIRWDGTVASVGSVTQNPPGQPTWIRSFHVVIKIEAHPADSRIRPGMTATVQILSYYNAHAITVPRVAVIRENGKDWILIKAGKKIERRTVRLGPANDTTYEVLEGLKPREIIVWP